MEVNGKTLVIESEKKVSAASFATFIAKSLYDWIEEEHAGDFSVLENDGNDYIQYLIGQYEDGERL